MASGWNDKRPMAPHLQIWRWHPAMLSSILHRITSVISYVALIKFSIGLLYLVNTGTLPLKGLLYSPLGAIGLGIGLFSIIFMALAQLRHLIWDSGKMFNPEFNNLLSYLMIAFAGFSAIALTIGITGGV